MLLLTLSVLPSWAAFSNATVNGTCSLSFVETGSDGGTNAAVGVLTFDGAGNVVPSGSQVANNGTDQGFSDFSNIQSGSYSVNADGTGTLNLVFSGPSDGDSLDIVVDQVSNGFAQEIRFMSTKTGKASMGVCRFQ